MQTVAYDQIDNATAADIGKIALMTVGAGTLAIADTLDECLDEAAACDITTLDDDAPGGQRPVTADDVDDHTDLRYLASGDLVAVIVGETE